MISTMRKFIAWLKGPKSDFFLFAVALVLLNLVASRAFLRLDLTEQGSYSLSSASREVVRTIERPLAVKVFFSEKLPAPYNSVERYLRDILVEYRGAANRNFDYEFFDMEKQENQDIAQSYGLRMIQVQEVKDNEVGVKNAWMGLALVYGDRIETLDGLISSDGLEYRLTTTISRMISTTNSLAGLSGKVQMTLYVSPRLGEFNINGFNQLEKRVFDAFGKVNRKSLDKLEYQRLDPADAGVDEIASRYGLQKVSWTGGAGGDGSGLIGIVLEYGDEFRVVPLELSRGIFGGYGIAGLDSLEQGITEGLQGLMSNSLVVGYTTGHGEVDLKDDREGAARFASIVSDMYTFKEFNPDTEEIPSNIACLVINGADSAFSESALFRIDQFVMRGGKVFILADPFNEIMPDQGMAMYGAEPTYEPIANGLERLLGAYGVSVGQNYVLDKACYEAPQKNAAKIPLYYVPLIGREGMNPKHSVSRNLAYVLFLQSASVDVKDALAEGVSATALVTSSPESWLMSGRISLSPWGLSVPGKDKMASHNLAVLLEGKFASAFDSVPEGFASGGMGAGSADGEAKSGGAKDDGSGSSVVTSEKRLDRGILPGKIIVVGTSKITTPAVIDEGGRQPVAIFVRNALDYLTGRGDLAEMRTKGLALNTLEKTSAAVRAVARGVNLYGLPALAAIVGLIAWRLRSRRRERIKNRYAGQRDQDGERTEDGVDARSDDKRAAGAEKRTAKHRGDVK